MELSVVIPVFNESGNIRVLYQRLSAVLQDTASEYPELAAREILFVDDGSTDDSLEIIRELSAVEPEVGYISFSRNFGHQIALSAGIDHASGNAVVIIDADLQDPPEMIGSLYAKWKEGYEVVFAYRAGRRGEGWFKKSTAKLFYKLISRITSIEIPLDTGDFRIMDKKVVEVLRHMPEKNKFLRGQVAWAGFRQTGIRYEREARRTGSTGYSFRRMLRLAMDGITAFSDLPLKLATVIGFLSFLFSLGCVVYALVSKIAGLAVPGWTSILIVVSLVGGLQLFCLGIIGEYIVRLIANSRNRPLYIIDSASLLPAHYKDGRGSRTPRKQLAVADKPND